MKKQLYEKQREIADYEAETIRVIRGESKLSGELLNTLITRAKEEEKQFAIARENAQAELDVLSASVERESEEYNRLTSWAEVYESLSFETRKMFIYQFIKSVHVFRDYDLEVEFNVSFEEFRDLKANK